jgi:RNA recognition motif-containing protein
MNNRNYDNEGTLWMGDLEYWMNESFIMNSFILYGFIPINVKLIIDKRFHKNKNFCFVTFNNLQEANNALFQLNRKKIPYSNSYFKLNLTKKSSENKKIIYVGNLPKKIGENELYRYFKSKYSSVISACVLSNNDKSKGYGFVNFTDETDYQNCLKEMDGKLFNSKKIKVKKKIISKEKNNKNKNFYFKPYFPNDKLSYLKTYNQNITITEPNFFIAKDSTITEDKENNSLSLNLYKKQNFLDDIKLLESNDNITLKKLNIKIQESFDKMIDYYKKSNKIKEIPKALFYYASNQNL